MFFPIAAAVFGATAANAQVTATGTMGVTNPPQATLGTAINQTSMARLLSLNAIDDFCLFAPPEPNSVIGDTEAYEVAWCMREYFCASYLHTLLRRSAAGSSKGHR